MIKVYTAPNCPNCHTTTRIMRSLGVEFTEVHGPDHAEHLRALGHRSYPVVETPTESWSGYNPIKIQELVK